MNEEQLSEASVNMSVGHSKEQVQEQGHHLLAEEINVGMALIPGGQLEITSRALEEARDQEATNLWGKFFSKGNSGDSIVKVPANWFFFFTTMLLSPDNFGWASEFFSSSASAQIFENQGNISFIIPKKCPVNAKHCISSLDIVLAKPKTLVEKGKGVMIQEIEETTAPYKKRRAQGD